MVVVKKNLFLFSSFLKQNMIIFSSGRKNSDFLKIAVEGSDSMKQNFTLFFYLFMVFIFEKIKIRSINNIL